jgi:transketolase
MINHLASRLPDFWGGSADLASSTKTLIKADTHFCADNYKGRNIWFGVREHAMGAAMNGIALHGGTKVYGGTFFVFSDYLRPSIRLAALQGLPVVYVLSHDSIAVGEDGPTHQPVEHLPSLRIIPGLTVIRPADARETAAAWVYCVQQASGPVALVLTRQGLPVLKETEKSIADLSKGAYILSETEGKPLDLILIASGSEVSLVMEAKKELETEGLAVRVVSMPSWELFEQQDEEYRNHVLPPYLKKRLAVEMAYPLGWERYVGDDGDVLGITTFGASAPGGKVMEEFGFTVSNVVQRAKALLNR